MGWYVGQRVQCIRDDWNVWHPAMAPNKPAAGNIYTIRRLNIAGPGNEFNGTGVGLYLHEVVNPVLHYADNRWREMSFDQIGFRAVKETDISVFTNMLAPCPEKETV